MRIEDAGQRHPHLRAARHDLRIQRGGQPQPAVSGADGGAEEAELLHLLDHLRRPDVVVLELHHVRRDTAFEPAVDRVEDLVHGYNRSRIRMDRNLSASAVSEQLGAFAAALRWEDVPREVRSRARHLILDAVGCALAARRFGFSSTALQGILDLAGEGESVVIGQKRRLPLRDAVLANGILAHGLDYDDTHSEGIAHLTVATFPAVLGVASQEGVSGKDLLLSYIAAIEAGARLASVAKGAFHEVGFHPTSVIGAFSSALAAGRLYGLNEKELTHAQGVALSTAAGSLQF